MKKTQAEKQVSRLAQKVMDSKITQKIWDKEANRFATMTEPNLVKRIFKITNPVKMEACRQVAKQYGYKKLARLAKEKRDLFCDAMV